MANRGKRKCGIVATVDACVRSNLEDEVLLCATIAHGDVVTAKTTQTAADGRRWPEIRGGHGAKTAAVREQAILALLSEPTIGQAAARCGIGERTLRRWLTEDAAFQAEYEAARHATFQAALRRSRR